MKTRVPPMTIRTLRLRDLMFGFFVNPGCTGTELVQSGTGFLKPNRISETEPVLNKNRPGPVGKTSKTEPDFKNRTGFKQEPVRPGPDAIKNRTGFQKPNRF